MLAIPKTFIGFLVLMLLLTLFNGFNNAFMILFASIVCTVGIGLVIWIPLSYAVGSFVFAIASNLSEKIQPKSTKVEKPSLTKEQKALIDYIKKARKSGLTDDRITSTLLDKGWTNEAVRDAFGQTNVEQAN